MESLKLLHALQRVFTSGNLKDDLNEKLTKIIGNYNGELSGVQDLYEKKKAGPPVTRNYPPVAGNVAWQQHLFHTIEKPMHELQHGHARVSTASALTVPKSIVKSYNKMARTLVEFQTLYIQQWNNSIESAKTGLQATLIVRHPGSSKLHVNLDGDIIQLIREAKLLGKMDVEIPETAKIMLESEQKFKRYYQELWCLLSDFEKVKGKCGFLNSVLTNHINHFEFILRPGMVTHSWLSMNVDGYLDRCWNHLEKLDRLVSDVVGLVKYRLERKLKNDIRSIMVFYDPPERREITIANFLNEQEHFSEEKRRDLDKFSQILENDSNDLLVELVKFEFVAEYKQSFVEADLIKLKGHYRHMFYQSIVDATNLSLRWLSERIMPQERPEIDYNTSNVYWEYTQDTELSKKGFMPIFDCKIILGSGGLECRPPLKKIVEAVRKAVTSIMNWSKISEWDISILPRDVQAILQPHLPPVCGTGSATSFHDRLSMDREVLKEVRHKFNLNTKIITF